jgi:hypothetical protein
MPHSGRLPLPCQPVAHRAICSCEYVLRMAPRPICSMPERPWTVQAAGCKRSQRRRRLVLERAIPESVGYGAAKAGMDGMMGGIALEAGPFG